MPPRLTRIHPADRRRTRGPLSRPGLFPGTFSRARSLPRHGHRILRDGHRRLPGSMAAAAFLADALDQASFQPHRILRFLLSRCWRMRFSPPRAASGELTITDLLLLSTVCGSGLDTVPIPGDSSSETLTALLVDLASPGVASQQAAHRPPDAHPGQGGRRRDSFRFPVFRRHARHAPCPPRPSAACWQAPASWICALGLRAERRSLSAVSGQLHLHLAPARQRGAGVAPERRRRTDHARVRPGPGLCGPDGAPASAAKRSSRLALQRYPSLVASVALAASAHSAYRPVE